MAFGKPERQQFARDYVNRDRDSGKKKDVVGVDLADVSIISEAALNDFEAGVHDPEKQFARFYEEAGDDETIEFVDLGWSTFEQRRFRKN
jgi:hypothetical protein